MLYERKRNVVIIAHSYGGVVAGAAARDLDKKTRSTHGQGDSGVVGLIYVAGNLTLEKKGLFKAVSGGYSPCTKENKASSLSFSYCPSSASNYLLNPLDSLAFARPTVIERFLMLL